MKKRIISILFVISIIFGNATGVIIPLSAYAAEKNEMEDCMIVSPSDIPLRLHYDEPAPFENENSPTTSQWISSSDIGWEQWSLPIGNGYMGASVFGRTETERIQIADKTLSNPFVRDSTTTEKVWDGGLNSFSETYIDFGHALSGVTDYTRYLDLSTAISGVEYSYGGVRYSREYFTSYPDKALVIRLDADANGALSFTLRPTIPYKQSYASVPTDGQSKTGEVTSLVTDDGIGYIELSGNMGYYDIDFLGIYRVYANGGTITADTAENVYTDADGTVCTDINGTISVSGATSAYIVMVLGSDYELTSEMFTSSDSEKPTFSTTIEDTRVKVEADMNALTSAISDMTYDEAYTYIKQRHISDHSELFGRVTLDLACKAEDIAATTDELIANYAAGDQSTYLEVLLFQYGRYLLIASSREGTLPAHLQGAWNTYNTPPWSCGYWHNINVQMNYWPAFSTNLAETFTSYIDFNSAYMEKAEQYADKLINQYNPSVSGNDGGNGWCIGTSGYQYNITSDRSAGNLGFTTELFWDYYQYTGDREILESIVFPMLLSAARYITKCVEQDEDGNYLVSYCDSPEQWVNGVWYHTTGTTYAQSFSYLNNYHALLAAKELGVDLADSGLLASEEYSILATVLEQIDKYDPIVVGLSGQVKEFREEDYYGSIGDPKHRHISQLVGLYPGNLINSDTRAWLDAAKVTLDGRGDVNSVGGWVYSHKLGLYARAGDGENARHMLELLLSTSTGSNLWPLLCNLFQIDANFGATAGIAEMLLQSDEGYITPLAAIPSGWSDGSYTGLVARGNFEVSAKWEDGLATTINILSKNGGIASVKYSSITEANVVRASDGKKVNYTVDGSDLISFDTEEGENYIIYGFRKLAKTKAPTGFCYEREEFGEFNLTWNETEDAIGYNVYVAVENAADYTLIGSTKTTKEIYSSSKADRNARTTFAVTAISSDGVESDRTLCYYNPVETSAYVNGVSGNVTESGALQVVVDANEWAAKYRLYEKKSGENEFTLLYESGFPLLVSECYNSDSVYAVSASSYFDGEFSELYVVDGFGGEMLDYDAYNILLGKPFVMANASNVGITNGYGYEKLTDGIIDVVDLTKGRFSTSKNKIVDGTLELGGTYILSEIRFSLYNRDTTKMGSNFTIQVYSDGKWINVYDAVSYEEMLANHIVTLGTGKADVWLVFDLGCVEGSKIRILSDPGTSGYVTFYEAECSGLYVGNSVEVYSDNIFAGKTFEGFQPTDASSGYTFTYDKLTDGIIDGSNWWNGRYSSKANGKAHGEIALGGVYSLSEIRFYDYLQQTNRAGENFKIDIYFGGQWINVISEADNAELEKYRVSIGNGGGNGWLAIDLGGVKAEKIRFTADAVTGNAVTLYEIECSGTLLYELGDYSENLLAGKSFVPTAEALANVYGSGYGYETLTDGVISGTSGRFSSKANLGVADATIDLGGEYLLSEIRFYDFTKDHTYNTAPYYMGQNFVLQVLSDGEWITIRPDSTVTDGYTCTTTEELQAYRAKKAETVAARGAGWIEFGLGNIKAEKIRFYAECISTYSISLYEIECSGYKLIGNGNGNVLADVDADVIVGGQISDISAASAFDGALNSALIVSGTAKYTVEMDLKFNTKLHTLKIYEQFGENNRIGEKIATASDKTVVELYRNGKWIKAADISLTSSGEYTLISLYGNECTKLRITFENTRLFDGESTYRSAVIREITCTAAYNSVDRSAMIEALEKLSCTVGEDEYRYLYDDTFLKFKGYASDFTAVQATVDGYADEINAYCDELTENPTYLVCFNYVDKDGNKVSASEYKYIAAGEEFKFISPAIDGYYTRDIYVQGTADVDSKVVNAVYRKIPENADAERVEKYLSDIVAWGDSITAGSGSNNLTSAQEYGIDLEALGSAASGANYVTVLKNLIMSRIYGDIEVDGCGVGGEASSTIASRADTETYYLYLDGAVTIGADAVTVPLAHYASGGRVGILRQGNDSHINPVTIKGYDAEGNEISVVGKISMALTEDAPEGTDKRTCDAKYLKYTFTRTDGGTDALSFASGARVITKASYLYDGRTCIIFMGENGGYSDVDELIKQQEEILAACGDPEYFLIISTTSGSNESRKEIREALTARWGENYINMGDELNSSRASYELAGYSKEVIDSVQSNIDEGTVTTLLLADRCHPNAVGYAVAGNVIFNRLYELGAFDEVLDYYDCLNGVIEHTFTEENDESGHWESCSVCGSSTDKSAHVYSDSFDTSCNECGYEREIESKLVIVGAYLNITENINVAYAVGVPAGYTNPYMVFEFRGNTYTVKDYTVDATGKLIFKFVGIVPQMIGDNISATLYATYNGETKSDVVAEYSVRTYCVNMLAKTTDAKLITLLSDLLTYGAASQTYTGETGALVTDGVEGLTPSEFAGVTASKKGITGEANELYKWNGAALRYENAMAMKLSFTVTDVTNLTVKVTINGRTTEFTADDFYTENGKYVVYFRGILATEYDDVVTASFYVDGEQVGQTVTYSVNSYVYTMQNSTNNALADLVKATYNYGASAVAYNK